jgi:eukaryotic-like serine/threonine-protein kinase
MTAFQSDKDTYEVEREYAKGGMGVTFLVRSRRTGQRLILKQMLLSRVEDWKMVELFEREAEVLRKLSHPQIPHYIDYFSDADKKQFSLVQSFIEGVTMQSMIDGRGSVKPDEFKSYLRQCLQILKYLHQMIPPVIHRDITPKNIILHDGKAFLVDFGSVKNMINPESSGLSTSVGTFGYMPPEQIMGQAVPASDMYSLGVSFIALATHSDPMHFPLNSKTGQIETKKLLAHLPENIRAILEQMTLPGIESRLNDPSERYDGSMSKPDPQN